jgi:hypothetical protein
VRTTLWSLLLGCLAGAALLAPAGLAAPASTSFTIVGHEYAFTSTVGSFAGRGAGDVGEEAVWNAYVKHDRLGSSPTYVNGGSFAMTTRNASDGQVDAIVGTFTHHSGTITTLKRGTNCANQQYRVTGALEDVQTTTSTGGSGQLSVTLTHYRTRVLGRCVAYRARVAGVVRISY